MERHALRDDRFARIENLLPGRPGTVGRNGPVCTIMMEINMKPGAETTCDALAQIRAVNPGARVEVRRIRLTGRNPRRPRRVHWIRWRPAI
jgi:hypothetical protein